VGLGILRNSLHSLNSDKGIGEVIMLILKMDGGGLRIGAKIYPPLLNLIPPIGVEEEVDMDREEEGEGDLVKLMD
jgi:hypothetical protein